MVDAKGFRDELRKFTEQTVPTRAVDVQKRMVAEALTLIVQATPVGNHTRWKRNVDRSRRGLPPLPRGYVGGHARKNWQVNIGSPSRSVLPGTDATGQAALTAGYSKLAALSAPGVVYISNPLPYVERLENGWSKQAPRGMVRQAIAAVSAKYRRVRE